MVGRKIGGKKMKVWRMFGVAADGKALLVFSALQVEET